MTAVKRCQAELNRLQALGSLDAIAAELKAQGVRGEMGQPGRCPLAVHLTKTTGAPWRVGITSTWSPGIIRETRVSLPPLVQSFRMAVDLRQYPGLLQDTEES